MADAVNHPTHYNAHPVCEAIDICEWLSFNLGNAVKYVWRAGQKGSRKEDLQKAAWYLRREQLAFRTIRVPMATRQLIRIVAEHPDTDAFFATFMQHLYLLCDIDLNEQDTGEHLTELILTMKREFSP